MFNETFPELPTSKNSIGLKNHQDKYVCKHCSVISLTYFQVHNYNFCHLCPSLTQWNAGRVENPWCSPPYLDGSLRQGGHVVEEGYKKTSIFLVKTNFTLGSIDPYAGT